MNGLFDSDTDESARIPLPDADIRFFERVLSLEDADSFFRKLHEDTQWRSEQVTVWGKKYLQPRLVAWYGDPGTTYSYSGSVLHPLPWTPLLQELKSKVSAVSGASFNSVLLNLYRDERDSMGWHSDNESELGPNPTIASISLGETREFQFKHVTRKDIAIAKIKLIHGSLLVMAGDTQKNWQHCIKKETAKLGPRINLTFRNIFNRKSVIQ